MSDDSDWFDDDEQEYLDDEYADEDQSDDDATATIACPHCRAEIYEDAVRCPVCEDYVTHGGRVLSGRPLWWILLGLAGVVAVVLALTGFFTW